MKICMISGFRYLTSLDEPNINGAQNSFHYLTQSLAESGIGVHVICRGKRSDPQYQLFGKVHVHRYVSLAHLLGDKQHTSLSPGRRKLLQGLYERYRFDLVHAITPLPLETNYIKKQHIPFLYTCYGSNLGFSDDIPVTVKGLLHKAAIRWMSFPALRKTLWQADKVLVVADSEMVTIPGHYGISRNKVTRIYNGVDIRIYNDKVDGARIKQKYDVQNKKVVMCVGRISPEKGIHHLIEVAPAIIRKHPQTVFMIVGVVYCKEYQKQINAQIDENNLRRNCLIVNDVPEKELPAYYAAGDIMVTFSEGYDPFPTVILEAMACGLPVVSTDWDTRKEIIAQGSNGVLVKEKDTRELYQKLLWLLENSEMTQKMGSQAHQTIRQHWAINRATQQYIRLYESYLNG